MRMSVKTLIEEAMLDPSLLQLDHVATEFGPERYSVSPKGRELLSAVIEEYADRENMLTAFGELLKNIDRSSLDLPCACIYECAKYQLEKAKS